MDPDPGGPTHAARIRIPNTGFDKILFFVFTFRTRYLVEPEADPDAEVVAEAGKVLLDAAVEAHAVVVLPVQLLLGRTVAGPLRLPVQPTFV
jgi:hypothetical protein